MLKTVEGIYRNGQIELLEHPAALPDETRVIVTFLASPADALPPRDLTQEQLAELRARLLPFAEDWERPDMDCYDDDANTNP